VRYALIDLLALTLLAGLATAIFVKREATSATAAKLAALQAAIDRDADDCRGKEREIKLFKRTIERRATDLGLLVPTVNRVADLLNQAALSLVKPAPHGGTVSRQMIPTFSRLNAFRERTKIYVPDKLSCELQVKFMGSNNSVGFFEDFEEPEQLSIPLVGGENLIDVLFDWNRVPNTFTVTNHTNAVSIRSLAKDARGQGWSPALGQGFYKIGDFSLQRGMTVFEGGMGFKKGTRIVVQMVGSQKQ
jgi:hypothetical protein